jgi:hypothetical protein
MSEGIFAGAAGGAITGRSNISVAPKLSSSDCGPPGVGVAGASNEGISNTFFIEGIRLKIGCGLNQTGEAHLMV